MRAKQRRFKDRDRKLGVPILIHGDAAFAGQGLVAETLNLSQLKGYRTGGTVHIVVNNQIGFTTSPVDSRSTRYCTDVAKMIEVPIFHVNGDDPEAVVYVAELALDFRETFGQDVVIDLVCYRKHGHNENDEPAFTQPLMYAAIQKRPTIRALYTEKLIASGELSRKRPRRSPRPSATSSRPSTTRSTTTPPSSRPRRASAASGRAQAGLLVRAGRHRRPGRDLKRIIKGDRDDPRRLSTSTRRSSASSTPGSRSIETGEGVDWGFGETLAFGSLLAEGIPVRLSGQDSRRGTFSHRHAVLVDGTNAETYVPLNTDLRPRDRDLRLRQPPVRGRRARLRLRLLARRAEHADPLGGPVRRLRQRRPGDHRPVHRLGRVEVGPGQRPGDAPAPRLRRPRPRALQRPARAVPLALRRGQHPGRQRDHPRPVLPPAPPPGQARLPQAPDRDDPQVLLRAKQAVSTLDDLASGRFQEVIDDPVAADRVKRVVLCSGKVYYDLVAKREEWNKTREVAILRLEQLYPWPRKALKAALGRYRSAREWVWCQEESQNMGGWTFVAPRLRELTGQDFQYVGRDASASPATGSHTIHDREQKNWWRPPSGPPSRTWSRRTTRPGRSSPSRARTDPMALVPIKVPKVSESISEGILASWLKPDGSTVKAGEPLFELETDKASQVFISPGAGNLEDPGGEGRPSRSSPSSAPSTPMARPARRQAPRTAEEARPPLAANDGPSSPRSGRRHRPSRTTAAWPPPLSPHRSVGSSPRLTSTPPGSKGPAEGVA